MSWVSQTNLKTIMTAIRNKFTTGDLVIANDDKSVGVEVNHTAQDGLVTVSPISTDASVESALHLSNGDDSKKTELTQGTLSYVTGTGDSEEYNYMSLLGDGVTFGKKGGGNVQVGGVADPTSAQQVATKNYVDSVASNIGYLDYTVEKDPGFSSGLAAGTLATIPAVEGKTPICATITTNKVSDMLAIVFCVKPEANWSGASSTKWTLNYIAYGIQPAPTFEAGTIIRIYYI